MKAEKWGYANTQGELICELKYDEAAEFDDNGEFAAVMIAEKWGFINAQGEEIVPLQYDEVIEFCNEMAAVCKDELWGFVNAKGEEVFSPQFDDVESFQEKGMTLGFIGEEPFILFENGKKSPLSQFAEFVNDITTKK